MLLTTVINKCTETILSILTSDFWHLLPGLYVSRLFVPVAGLVWSSLQTNRLYGIEARTPLLALQLLLFRIRVQLLCSHRSKQPEPKGTGALLFQINASCEGTQGLCSTIKFGISLTLVLILSIFGLIRPLFACAKGSSQKNRRVPHKEDNFGYT